MIDNFSKYVWTVPLKSKKSPTISDEFSIILSTSKRKPINIESDQGKDFPNSIFEKVEKDLKLKKIQHFSSPSDKTPSIAKRFNATIRDLKEPVFQRGDATWLSELPSVIKQKNNTIHN